MSLNKFTFNEFQRELRNRNIDGQTAFMFTVVYEQMRDQQKQLEAATKIVAEMAQNMALFIDAAASQERAIKKLQKEVRGEDDGISVKSVATIR